LGGGSQVSREKKREGRKRAGTSAFAKREKDRIVLDHAPEKKEIPRKKP